MCAILQPIRVRKLTGKPAFLTIADCESEARRIHSLSPAGIRHGQDSIPQPNGFILVSRLNRLLNGLELNLVYASAQHDFAGLSTWQFGPPHLFAFCHTISVDEPYFLSYPKSTIKTAIANNLETEKKVLAVSMLAEGNSIRSVECMTGVHRDTIMRLSSCRTCAPAPR